jgi:ADP-ribose pyrophosphatase
LTDVAGPNVAGLALSGGRSDLVEERVDGNQLYDGRIIRLRVDRVRLPGGRIVSREVIEHRPAVVVLAENKAGEVLLIDQFRYPANEVLIELPAGIVEDGEEYEAAAIRELQEETGWRPGSVTKVAEFFSSPGFTSELLVLFYASGLSASKLPEDEDELIIPRFESESAVEELLSAGAIRDGKTLFGLYWWLHGRKTGKIG